MCIAMYTTLMHMVRLAKFNDSMLLNTEDELSMGMLA